MKEKESKKGDEGAMILVAIALILVATIAAGVVIFTASDLQSKSYDVSHETRDKVTTNFEIIQFGVNGTSDGEITAGNDTYKLVLGLGVGSENIRFSNLVLKLDSGSGSQLIYEGTNISTTSYQVNYLVNRPNHKQGHLILGEIAELKFVAQNTLGEREKATLWLIEKNGPARPVYYTTPSAMLDSDIYFYP